MTFVGRGVLMSRLYLIGSRLVESSNELRQASSLSQLDIGFGAHFLLSQARLVGSSVSQYGFSCCSCGFGIAISNKCGSDT
jgi:hypothetical protein